jgi:glutamate--cysteine ligase
MELEQAVHGLFAPARRPGRIGVEIELIPVTAGGTPRPVDPAVLAEGLDAGFVASARPTFEPGGQLELSPPPYGTVAGLVDDVRRLLTRAAAIADRRGVRLETVGTNPYHSCAEVPLRTPTPRYLAMQREFDRLGPNGRRMMRLTASLQIAIDLLPGPAGREQWLVANLAGPPLAVVFANSTVIDGRPTAIPGARTPRVSQLRGCGGAGQSVVAQ